MKTVIEMARECGINFHQAGWPELERLVEIVRADEREACANLVFNSPTFDEYECPLVAVYKAIRARSQYGV